MPEPLLRVELPGQTEGHYAHARDWQLDDYPGIAYEEAKRADATLGIQAPENTRALSLQALVRLAMGQNEEAEAMLKKALAKDPDLLDAWIHLAIVHQQMGRNDEALAALEEAMRRHPEERATLESLAAELRGVPAAMPGAGAGSAAPPQQPAMASGPSVSGTVELAPGLVARGQLVIAVRPAGVSAGPPIAVKMLGAVALPASFNVSSSDSMMGQQLPEKVRIDARLDTDGNVMSRSPGDPQASADNVSRLVISRRFP